MTATIEERVARGVEYMDTYAPEGWRDMIDLNALSIISTDQCVWGQVFRDPCSYMPGYGLHKDAFYRNTDGKLFTWDYGFNATDGEWTELDEEWRRVLSAS